MVEPLDAQNLLSRTPLVEKAAAAQREQAATLNQALSQLEKDKKPLSEHVQPRREPERAQERRQDESRPQDEAKEGKRRQGQKAAGVEWVATTTDEPEHNLDVTV
jgi:hypothetical protein